MSRETIRTLRFTFLLCLFCASILSLLASSLSTPQERARTLDQNKQMLLAARILAPDGRFQLRDPSGLYIPARVDPQTKDLTPDPKASRPSDDEILALYARRIRPMLTDSEGNLHTFEEAKLDLSTYLREHKKTGYAHLPLKLLYLIVSPEIEGYVIPINGFGLWDAIYGYLALEADALTVRGATWYQQAETAGLGANIALPEWQAQFGGKEIFLPEMNGAPNLERAPLGITVIKGKVSEVFPPHSPKALTSVDGISGASLTGKGVTDAYRDCLTPYRPFLIRAHRGNP